MEIEPAAIDEVRHTSSMPAETDFAVFERLYPALHRFASVVSDRDMDPDDLVQEALASTLERYDLCELDQPQAYLKRAIFHIASNKRRSAGRFRALLPRLSERDTASDHYPSDLAILYELGPTDRAVIYLADVEGLPLAVIAEQLGLSGPAVRKRVGRARAKLRELVDAEESLPEGSRP